jgi:DNA-binding MltR family transcriptional regulator
VKLSENFHEFDCFTCKFSDGFTRPRLDNSTLSSFLLHAVEIILYAISLILLQLLIKTKCEIE